MAAISLCAVSHLEQMNRHFMSEHVFEGLNIQRFSVLFFKNAFYQIPAQASYGPSRYPKLKTLTTSKRQ